jgi:adenylate cyclase
VIAYPDSIWKQSLDETNNDQLPHLDQFGIEWLSNAYRQVVATDNAVTHNLEIDGTGYFAKLVPVDEQIFKDWRLLFVVPEYAILSSIERGLATSVILAIILLIISIYIIYWIASRLTAPLQQIVNDADMLQQLRFADIKPLHSPYSEFNLLNESMQKMRFSLAAFSKYVPTALIRTLMDQNNQSVQLGGEARDLVVLTCEVSEFNALSHDMGAQKKVLYLSRYQTEVTKELRRNDATIDKFIGDKIIAFWGAPIASETDAYKACDTALKTVDAIQHMNHHLRSEGLPPLKIRLGLMSDELIVGNFGSNERMFYSMLGDGVKHSESIGQLNKQYGSHILVCDSTYQAEKQHYIFRWMDVITLPGRPQPISIYELIAPIDATLDTGTIEYIHHYENLMKLIFETKDLEKAHSQLQDLLEQYPHDQPLGHQLDQLNHRDASA